MPTQAEAAAILRAAMDAGFDPVKLRALQSSRAGELSDRYANDLGTNDLASARRDRALMGDLSGDMSSDPYTGDAEQKRIDAISGTLDSAAMLQRPEMQDASETTARRNAFAQFVLGKSKYQAENSPEARTALDAASARRVAEAEAGSGAKLFNAMTLAEQRAGLANDKPIAPNTQSASSLTALQDIEHLAPQVLQRLRETHPGIENDPAKYGGVGDTIAEKAKRFAYGVGLYTPNEDIGQLTQLLRVIAARPYMQGRPNQRVYNDIVSHLGEFGFSPGADYARISKILELVPDLRDAVYAGQQPIPRRAPGAASGGAISDPNWGQQ